MVGGKLKKSSRVLISTLFTLTLCVGCVTGGASSVTPKIKTAPLQTEGSRTVDFSANATVYHIASVPNINERSFKSRVTIDKRASIVSYKFENFVTGQKKADNSVILAISGNTAGLGIYDWSGAPLVEYGNGKVNGPAVTFIRREKSGKTEARWIIGDDIAISQINTFNAENFLIHSEITTYRAK